MKSMNKAPLRTAIFFLILLFPVFVLQSSHAQSSQPLEVRVNNFPETQQIKGAVSIEGTMSHSRYLKREGFTVPPSRRNELSDEEPIMRSLRDAKRVQLPIESVARVGSGDTTFSNAEQVQQRVVFPRYRIFIYNTVNKAVETNVYLYLSN